MVRKVALLVVSLMVVMVLLLVSCGPTTPTAPTPVTPTPATPAPALTTPTLTPGPTPTPAASAEKPKYGGTINIISQTDLTPFPLHQNPGVHSRFVYQQLLMSDWSRGPAGTGESSFNTGMSFLDWKDVTGQLAESFETPEVGVWVVNIRKGVHWALDPKNEASRLVNGREFTADDVVASIRFVLDTPNSRHNISIPYLTKVTTIEKTGPWQVTVKTPGDPMTGFSWFMSGPQGGVLYMWPKEVIEKYGKTMEWQNVVGTGPYMITDYVSGSAGTFTRNPNYWEKNPVGPGKGDQLPYPDGVKYLVVPDLSTRLAALRTGAGDLIEAGFLPVVEWEDAQSLIQTTPRLKYHRFLPEAMVFHMRMDKQDLPYKDIRVRQALQMAVDYESIKNDFYQGQAEIFTTPVMSIKGSENVFIPLNQLPKSAQALYQYNPARAKQLLAEAGYPNGFKAQVIVQNTSVDVDSASIFKAMWAKIGVDLEIQPREPAVFTSISVARSYDEMIFVKLTSFTDLNNRYKFKAYRGVEENSYFNDPPGKDPVIEAAYQEVQKNVILNFPKADEIVKGLIPHLVEQAYVIPRPSPYMYRFWQPWVKNYYGDFTMKHWIRYPWIDQDMKEQMIGRR